LLKSKIKQDGFTLIEVLVSIVILGIILTTFISFFNQSLVFSGKNEEKLVAYNLASRTLKIVDNRFKNILPSTQPRIEILSTNISCSPTEEQPALKWDATNPIPSLCYYTENQKKYFPEIIISKQTTDFSSPTLFTVNVKIYSAIKTDPKRKLLSETFGYVRGKP
jgi:prepilin-type N-terminal cleavage/methylation domain-containing protein